MTGECFLVEVQQQDANTLLPFIAQYIRPELEALFTAMSGVHTVSCLRPQD